MTIPLNNGSVQPCPSCGYCPTCGRRNVSYPHPYQYPPYYYGVSIGDNVVSNVSGDATTKYGNGCCGGRDCE